MVQKIIKVYVTKVYDKFTVPLRGCKQETGYQEINSFNITT